MSLMNALAKQEGSHDFIDGLSPEQRFFLGWGQIWCTNATDQALRLQVQSESAAEIDHAERPDTIRGRCEFLVAGLCESCPNCS